MTTRKLSVILALLPLVSMVGCDHATKLAAKTHLAGNPAISLIDGVFELRYVENDDVGFGALRWIPLHIRRPLMLGVGAVTILALLFLAFRRQAGRLERFAFIVLLAGAIGNSADRLFRGEVVDFLHLTHWPIFNVADICLVVGMVLICWVKLKETRAAQPATP